jgi:hypothetical protein
LNSSSIYVIRLAKENLPTVYDSEKWSNLVISSNPTGRIGSFLGHPRSILL